jgi:cell division GTPase FtsZ
MLPSKVIGIGAAGNKASIGLIEKGIMGSTEVLLLNSTLKDVPAAYKEYAIEFKGATKGCAKERSLAEEMAIENITNGYINLDGFLAPEDKTVIIVNSSEGGTGCGASTVLAQYFGEVLEVNVHMFVFTGFEEDGRGLKNTVDYFKNLSPRYTIEGISNKKFLDECNGNKIKAEQAANEEFAKRVSILVGKTIVESEQNIDSTDLFKLATAPGFMTIEHGNLGKIKNVEDFNKVVTSIIDKSKSLDVTSGCAYLGIILNIHEKTRDYIDYYFTAITNKFGKPDDTIFLHIQDVHEEEYIQIIASGMRMPTDEIKEVYDEFVARMNKVDRSTDKFFDMNFDTAVPGFDMSSRNVSASKIQENKANFFKKVGGGVPVKNGTFRNTKVSDEI